MKKFVLALLALLGFGCQPKPLNPTVFYGLTEDQKVIGAKEHAKRIGGLDLHVLGESMMPFIQPDDYAVVHYTQNVEIGKIYVYNVKWYPVHVIHRATAVNGKGFIFSGDNNRNSERGDMTVYPEQIIGEVVALYTSRHQ